MAGAFDPDVWSADVASLFRRHSALVRAGAAVLLGDRGVRVPYVSEADVQAAARFFPAGGPADPPDTLVTQSRLLHPATHRLAAQLVVADGLVDAIDDDPRLVGQLKSDLARALAHRADHAFLHGSAARVGSGPDGITDRVSGITGASDPLMLHRALLLAASADRPLGRGGWILHPHALAVLAEHAVSGGTLEPVTDRALAGAVVRDGADGGTLLGLPYVLSAAARLDGRRYRTFLAVDWSEAWLVAASGLVGVGITTGSAAHAGATVIRAEIDLDFGVRRPGGFWVGELDES